MVRVLSTEEFDMVEPLLGGTYQKDIQSIINQLKQSWQVGKPLGYPFFREKKFGGKFRAYFLIYEDLDAVLLVTIGDKKAQQETIERIKSELDHYREIIREKLL